MDLRLLAALAVLPLSVALLVDVRAQTAPPTVTAPTVTAPTRPAPLAEQPEASPSAAPPVARPRSAAVVVRQGDGQLHLVPGTGAKRGSGPVRRYAVQVEGGLGIDPAAFATAVEATLGDRRSWGRGGRAVLQRVDRGRVDFRVTLASPQTVDRLCAPLTTAGRLSCAQGERAVINAARWQRGAASYGNDLAGYRQYVVNHEVGHVLGRGHEDCAGAGRVAAVMVQQTLGLQGCRRGPWPFP